jgi:hypothetical protein
MLIRQKLGAYNNFDGTFILAYLGLLNLCNAVPRIMVKYL